MRFFKIKVNPEYFILPGQELITCYVPSTNQYFHAGASYNFFNPGDCEVLHEVFLANKSEKQIMTLRELLGQDLTKIEFK